MDLYYGIGQIGDRGMAPKETTHNGSPFRRCGVWIDDPFGEPVFDENNEPVYNQATNKQQLKRKSVQLIFDQGERGASLFPNLRPGRRVAFVGRLSARPRVAEWNGKQTRKELLTDPSSQKQYEAWENLTVHVMRLDFVDPPLRSTLERYLQEAVQAGKMDEEAAADLTTCIVERLSNRGTATSEGTEQAAEGTETGTPPSDSEGDEETPF